jgi:hypothetical protein
VQFKLKTSTSVPQQRRRVEIGDPVMVDVNQKRDRAIEDERKAVPGLPARGEFAVLSEDA